MGWSTSSAPSPPVAGPTRPSCVATTTRFNTSSSTGRTRSSRRWSRWRSISSWTGAKADHATGRGDRAAAGPRGGLKGGGMAALDKLDGETRLVALRLGVAGVVALGMVLLMYVFGQDRCIAEGGKVIGWLDCELAVVT